MISRADPVSHGHQHLEVLLQFSLVGEMTVSRDHFRISITKQEYPFHRRYHAIYRTARGEINERVRTVKINVPHVDDIGFLKMNDRIPVGMGTPDVKNEYFISIQIKGHILAEGDDRQRRAQAKGALFYLES